MNTTEPLESRIAPAALFVNATTATYSDADGDFVTVKFSKPILTAANVGAVVFTGFATALGESLRFIDFTGLAAAEGTNITVTAKLQLANADAILDGDGLANVGEIRAAGIDLGAVSIKGTLGSVDAGNSNTKTPGVKSLAVQSLGVAQHIGALKIAGTAFPLLAGASIDNRQLGAGDDVHLREI